MENSRDKIGLKEQNNSNEPTHIQGHKSDELPFYTVALQSVQLPPSTSSTNKKEKINRIDNVFESLCTKPNKNLNNDFCTNNFKKYCTLSCKYHMKVLK